MKHLQNHIKSTPILDLYADQADEFLTELDQRVNNRDGAERQDAVVTWIN